MTAPARFLLVRFLFAVSMTVVLAVRLFKGPYPEPINTIVDILFIGFGIFAVIRSHRINQARIRGEKPSGGGFLF
jgi:hypothetical protein